jgi:hypothetical protein
MDWIKYIVFLHYAFHAAMVLEFADGDPISCAKGRDLNTTYLAEASQFKECLQPNVTHVASAEVLKFYEIEWTFWEYLLPLFIFIFVFRLAGYLVLRFVFRPQSG